MTPTIRLGKVFGIEVDFNWSLLFIFAFIAFSLATQSLPALARGDPALLYWVFGIVGAVLFYLSLLAHEFAHALVARSFGVKVEGITLWLFGGVSRLQGEAPSARAEALIAGVGPLTSFGVAVAAGVLWIASQASAITSGLFGYLAVSNLALGLFNLVPAFPLDGGRLLSSLLWWRSGNRQRGVHDAVRVGRVFAYLMIAGGAVELFLGQGLNGIWIAFVGWFLLSAGSAEEAGSTMRTALRSVPVSAAMTSPVVTVPDWVTVATFLESAAPNHRFTTYPVHDASGALTGVVRLSDLVRMPPDQRAQKHLKEVARPIADVPVTNPREDLAAMIERVGAGIDQRVLVFDAGQLVGIVSPADLARVITLRQTGGVGPPVGRPNP